MKDTGALGAMLVAALSGSLLIGCTSDNVLTDTSTTPSATTPTVDPLLIGSWIRENPRVSLEMTDLGSWTGESFSDLVGGGRYEIKGDTVTWYGGLTCEALRGIYTYTVENGRFTQTVKDDPCSLRKEAFDGATFRPALPEGKARMILGELAAAGIETESIVIATEEASKRAYCENPPGANTSSVGAFVVVNGMAVLLHDPDLDLDKVSEVLGAPVTPPKEYCDAG